MKYKKMVLYKEKAYQNRDDSKPSIENNLNILTDEQRDRVLKYLNSGHLLLNFVSPTTDPYDQETSLPLGIYTDGIYVWDTIIIHWVKCYKVRLPDDFLNHVLSLEIFLYDLNKSAEFGGVNDVMKNSEPVWIDTH